MKFLLPIHNQQSHIFLVFANLKLYQYLEKKYQHNKIENKYLLKKLGYAQMLYQIIIK